MLEFRSLPDAAARLTGIHVSFDGRAALSDVDVTISSGTVTVITGPNGAGKSTLLEVLGGTRAAATGTRSVRGAVAFVPQRAAIPPGLPVSVKDVVSVGAWGRLGPWRRMDAAARDLVERSMDRLDIRSLERHPFASLSGGQQQRALLAQGLARRADLLLLDEPTTGLDAESALRIRAVLREEAARGVAVVCVSHDPAVIGDADQEISLREGRV
ncbi:MAG: ATP-binding cassette protein [Microbacterium sp.]|jgi:zinc/manganese transport system ATP-binding protein|uniref:zinc ABC transporter ATP-binding protein AztA n=1 Tax=Microbacterium sp. TaxID=51671 RepID=UPI00261813D4|nr:zinc ABC transporter ATP-binding protein AztA [Microbacterium sp.]MDF2560364.1 ATP-binding cassette protein [Microbacterium sp.]